MSGHDKSVDLVVLVVEVRMPLQLSSDKEFGFVPLKMRHFPLKMGLKPYKENCIGRSAKGELKA